MPVLERRDEFFRNDFRVQFNDCRALESTSRSRPAICALSAIGPSSAFRHWPEPWNIRAAPRQAKAPFTEIIDWTAAKLPGTKYRRCQQRAIAYRIADGTRL